MVRCCVHCGKRMTQNDWTRGKRFCDQYCKESFCWDYFGHVSCRKEDMDKGCVNKTKIHHEKRMRKLWGRKR